MYISIESAEKYPLWPNIMSLDYNYPLIHTQILLYIEVDNIFNKCNYNCNWLIVFIMHSSD